MLYMFLICYDPGVPPEGNLQPQHAALEQELRDEGVYAGGAALMPTAAVPPVRVGNGKVLATDGPFAETKEVIGGFYVIECKHSEDAARFAARIPIDTRSWIQFRPIVLWHPK